MQEGQHLDGLAQSHVVGQYAAEIEGSQVIEPAQTFLLIGPQFSLEPGGGFQRLDAFERVQLLADLGESGVAFAARLSGEERVEQSGLRLAEAQGPFIVGRAEVGEEAVFLEPLLGEHAHRAVAQGDHGLPSAGGGEDLGQGQVLAAEVDLAREFEPVDAGVHGELEVACRPVQDPLGLDSPAFQYEVAGRAGTFLGVISMVPGSTR